MLSDSEEEKPSEPASRTKSNVRVRKRAVVSDDEDEPPVTKSRKSAEKTKAVDAELQAMMDIDEGKKPL